MAVLTADTYIRFMPNPYPTEVNWKVGAISDEFYVGAILTGAVGAGLALPTSVDASEFIGMCNERKSFTGTAGFIRCYINGIFWSNSTIFADANVIATTASYLAATAASDNPTDIVTLAAGTTGQIGTMAHVDVTGTSGWFDSSIGARGARGTNS